MAIRLREGSEIVVLATGSANWTDRRLVAKAFYAVQAKEPKDARFCLVHCGRGGAEFLARDMAVSKRWRVFSYRAPDGSFRDDVVDEALRDTCPHYICVFDATPGFEFTRSFGPSMVKYVRSPGSRMKGPPQIHRLA